MDIKTKGYRKPHNDTVEVFFDSPLRIRKYGCVPGMVGFYVVGVAFDDAPETAQVRLIAPALGVNAGVECADGLDDEDVLVHARVVAEAVVAAMNAAEEA